MRDLDTICTNHFGFVLYAIETVFHSGNLAADYVSTRSFKINRNSSTSSMEDICVYLKELNTYQRF
jgi:hypothetical protein